MYNYLLRFTNENAVIAITSILFAPLHLAFISFYWLIPFAFCLGYLRKRTGSIVYGIILQYLSVMDKVVPQCSQDTVSFRFMALNKTLK